MGLPPDLAQLGDEIVAAATSAALAFAALTPAALDPGQPEFTIVAAAERLAPPDCDYTRGTRYALLACEGPMILHRPYAIN